MIWVRAYVSDALENHCDTLIKFLQATPWCVVTIWHMTQLGADQLSEDVQRIVQGYTFAEPAIELGVLMENDAAVPGAVIRIPLSMLNRHGLVAGATGTGKTKTLQLMAEQISAAGVPVFAADI